MTLAVIGNKEYALLGRLLYKRNRQAAVELLSDFHNSYIIPREKDLTHLPSFLAQFCEHYGVETSSFIATKHKREVVQNKKVFIAAILSLYCPGALEDPEIIRQSKTGIVYGIGEVLCLDHSNISKMIHSAIHYMKVYDSFRQEVVEVTEKLFSHGKSA